MSRHSHLPSLTAELIAEGVSEPATVDRRQAMQLAIGGLPYEQQRHAVKPPLPLGTNVQRQSDPEADVDTETEASSDTAVDDDATPRFMSKDELDQAYSLAERFPDGLTVSLMIPTTLPKDDAVALALVNERGTVLGTAYCNAYEAYWKTNAGDLEAVGCDRPTWADLSEEQKEDAKDLLWDKVRSLLVKYERINDKYIRNKAIDFAKELGSAYVTADGALDFGQPMEYANVEQLGDLVVAAHDAAHRLLMGATLEDPFFDTLDIDRIARISTLTISAHGDDNWLGAHYLGASASFSNDDLPTLTTTLAPALNDDVLVRLFACATAKSAKEADGFAYDLALALAGKGKTDAVVVGHSDYGKTTKNEDVSFVLADGSVYEWRPRDMLTERVIDDELDRFGFDMTLDSEGWELLYDRMFAGYGDLLQSEDAKDLFSESGWVGGAATIEELRASFWEQWRAAQPERPSFYEPLLVELEPHQTDPDVPVID